MLRNVSKVENCSAAHNLKVIGSNPIPATNFEGPIRKSRAFGFMGKYRVYIIVDLQGRHYMGLSEDVLKRLTDHNAGTSKWTSRTWPMGTDVGEPQDGTRGCSTFGVETEASKGRSRSAEADRRIQHLVRLMIPRPRDQRFKSSPRNQFQCKGLHARRAFRLAIPCGGSAARSRSDAARRGGRVRLKNSRQNNKPATRHSSDAPEKKV